MIRQGLTREKKVFVGMSGGVDSSVSAALLVRAGYDVTGVFIKVWQPDWFACTWREDRLDAMRVAAQLDIPFVTLDLSDEYKREVVDHMISEYRLGRTPNPDVMCNRHVKFGAFFDWAMARGADYVATGHYAKVEKGGNVAAEKFKLIAGDDANKDQSYFLWTLGQRELSKTLFPVGDIEKPEVRRLATRFKLPNADKKDSQGLCFIGKIDVKEFLAHYIEMKSGDVLLAGEHDGKARVIGSHDGSWFYTIGERHGFDVQEKTPHDEPYYVVARDVDKNTITVAQKMSATSLPSARTEVVIGQLNWTLGQVPEICRTYTARARYRQPLVPMKITALRGDTAEIEFDLAQDTLSAGQSLVIYDGSTCLGGGVIL